jgi:hypothetical protein
MKTYIALFRGINVGGKNALPMKELVAALEDLGKRFAARLLAVEDWFTDKAEDPYWLLDTVEFKTAWHPMGL